MTSAERRITHEPGHLSLVICPTVLINLRAARQELDHCWYLQ